jgi:DNA replication protein DnaC
MTHVELNERLKLRIDWWQRHPGPFEGPACEGLEVGDLLHLEGLYPGWTKREVDSTPHLCITRDETDAELLNYLRDYWLAEWKGGPNTALEKRLKMVEQHKAAEEKYTADRARIEKAYIERYGPPPAYRTKTYANFKTETPMQQAALEAAEKYPYSGGPEIDKPLNIVLAGPAGVGKTHIAAAFFNNLWDWNGSTEFITATALIRKFREKEVKESVLLARYGEGKDDSADPLDGGCEVLVVDDICAGADVDRYASEIFCEILDRRMGADLLTMFTTNCTRVEMREWLGERGYSRLLNRCKWVALDGDDRRLRDPRPQKNLKDST